MTVPSPILVCCLVSFSAGCGATMSEVLAEKGTPKDVWGEQYKDGDEVGYGFHFLYNDTVYALTCDGTMTDCEVEDTYDPEEYPDLINKGRLTFYTFQLPDRVAFQRKFFEKYPHLKPEHRPLEMDKQELDWVVQEIGAPLRIWEIELPWGYNTHLTYPDCTYAFMTDLDRDFSVLETVEPADGDDPPPEAEELPAWFHERYPELGQTGQAASSYTLGQVVRVARDKPGMVVLTPNEREEVTTAFNEVQDAISDTRSARRQAEYEANMAALDAMNASLESTSAAIESGQSGDLDTAEVMQASTDAVAAVAAVALAFSDDPDVRQAFSIIGATAEAAEAVAGTVDEGASVENVASATAAVAEAAGAIVGAVSDDTTAAQVLSTIGAAARTTEEVAGQIKDRAGAHEIAETVAEGVTTTTGAVMEIELQAALAAEVDAGCRTNGDCKGARICDQGKCIDPPQGKKKGKLVKAGKKSKPKATEQCLSDMNCPGDQVCDKHRCLSPKPKATAVAAPVATDSGCLSDMDCKGNRICVDRRCIDPNKRNLPLAQGWGKLPWGATLDELKKTYPKHKKKRRYWQIGNGRDKFCGLEVKVYLTVDKKNGLCQITLKPAPKDVKKVSETLTAEFGSPEKNGKIYSKGKLQVQVKKKGRELLILNTGI